MTTLLRLPEVKNITGLSRASIYLFMSKGEFPKSVSIGDRAVAWVDSDIQDWIEERINLSRK